MATGINVINLIEEKMKNKKQLQKDMVMKRGIKGTPTYHETNTKNNK